MLKKGRGKILNIYRGKKVTKIEEIEGQLWRTKEQGVFLSFLVEQGMESQERERKARRNKGIGEREGVERERGKKEENICGI